MAHFLEHLVFKGGEKYDDYRKVNETAERMGAVLNAYTSHDLVAFHITVRAEVVRRGDRPADRLRRPPEDRRRRARPRARRRDPGDRSATTTSRRPSPSSSSTARRSASTRSAARCSGPRSTCGRSRATRSSPSASAAGPARAAARSSSATSSTCPTNGAVAELFERFPTLPRQRRPTSPRRPSAADARRGARLQPVAPADAPTGPQIDAAHPRERAALTIYSTLLGGSMGSRLFDEIREQRGLAYSVYSVDHSFADAPLLQLSAGPGVRQVRRGLRAHARDRRRAARRGPDARTRSSAPARTPPAAACSRSRTRTRSRATRPRRPIVFGEDIDPDAAITALDETTFDEVARGRPRHLGEPRWPASARTKSRSSPLSGRC